MRTMIDELFPYTVVAFNGKNPIYSLEPIFKNREHIEEWIEREKELTPDVNFAIVQVIDPFEMREL